MSGVSRQHPYPKVDPSEAVRRIAAIQADRAMTLVTYPYGGDIWVIHRNEAAKRMLEDSRFARQPFARHERDLPYPVPFPEFLKTTIQFEDPPEHTKLRRLVAKAFGNRRVDGIRDKTQRIAHELLDAMEAHGSPANLASEYAYPLPIRVITDLLGVPLSDREKFVHWAHAVLATFAMTAEESAVATAELRSYLTELIAERHASPRDDLLSALAEARDSDDTLTEDEILPIAMIIIAGGFDNTANNIDSGVHALLRNPEVLAVMLRDIDGVIGTAVEEILRHAQMRQGIPVAGISGHVPFMATEDVEIDGNLIKAGECVMSDTLSNNHDPRVFECPEKFDITRERNPHLTLNHGRHLCLGASLARMEMQVAIGSLFKRFPQLSLAGEPEYLEGVLTGGMTVLPVRW
jgi:cytochrome P450